MKTDQGALNTDDEQPASLPDTGATHVLVESIVRGVERFRLPGSTSWSAIKESFDDISGVWKLSAVLVPVVLRPAPTVLLTKRSSNLSEYSSHVSFPGGRPMESDHDVGCTALRESFEEICLDPNAVRLVGCLPIHKTRKRNHAIVPVIGLVSATAAWAAAPAEVEEIFELPLATLLNSALPRQYTDGERAGAWYWADQEYDIWGVTAVILNSVAELLRAADSEHDEDSRRA
ncbi:NUDIX hydrolase [Burkholderia sp. IMCC1007]|uniref:NUDIX hydrolase n=1 Tax=Burkholderia sp. IMCC1007 TaxID=3004104 RepID=UPI0022B4CA9A|nr:CoA pyrophosphatase [Burkholderia sp. IMCC1007]